MCKTNELKKQYSINKDPKNQIINTLIGPQPKNLIFWVELMFNMIYVNSNHSYSFDVKFLKQ